MFRIANQRNIVSEYVTEFPTNYISEVSEESSAFNESSREL